MQSTMRAFESWDGTALTYRHWGAAKPTGKALILFHRGHEHSARWQDVVEKLALPEFDIYAWDARGHGLSPGERGYADSFTDLVKDADAFARHVCRTHGHDLSDIVVIGHSVGAVVATAWLHDFAPEIRGLVLGNPAFRVRLYAPFAIPALRLWRKLRGKTFVSSYVKGRLLTRDRAKAEAYDADPLITPRIAVNLLLDLRDTSDRLIADAGTISVPTLILRSGADFVVDRKAQQSFHNRLGHPVKTMRNFPGFRHDIFNERDNDLPIAEMRRFIVDMFEISPIRHRQTATEAEFASLKTPLPAFSGKRWKFAVTRLAMRSVGRLSRGIRVGLAHGFDSGSMLDYVYENRARGWSFLGRLIDRAYLNAPGWRGIRQRGEALTRAIRRAAEAAVAQDGEARLLDVAAGHGRYLFDAIDGVDGPVTARLQDFCPENVRTCRTRVADLGLTDVVVERGDAFDTASLARLEGRTNVAVVSGLYELFDDNDRVAASLAGIHAALAHGGWLIYTNQPWHPQIELIARTLTSHRDDQPWIMRRRPQREMDELVAAAGFVKVAQDIDNAGIFTVALARKRPVRPQEIRSESDAQPLPFETRFSKAS